MLKVALNAKFIFMAFKTGRTISPKEDKKQPVLLSQQAINTL
jgi:hypothetical protein